MNKEYARLLAEKMDDVAQRPLHEKCVDYSDKPYGVATLKPDDPAWVELIADIKRVVSSRYAEDPAPLCSPLYMSCGDEPGFEFSSLHRGDRLDLIVDMVSWRHYECQGITDAQQLVIVGNVLDGKPQDRWLEGVFDRDVEKTAFRNILQEETRAAEPPRTQDRGMET